jgi:hypothetical protein
MSILVSAFILALGLLILMSPNAVVLHFTHYNFARIHRSLRVAPAMEAGV